MTFLYVYVCLIGSLYHLSLLASFGIPYFEFADVSDLFLAGFRHPVAAVVSIGFVVLLIGAIELVIRHRMRPSTGAGWAKLVLAAVFLLVGIATPSLEGNRVADRILRGWGTYVRIEFAPGVASPWVSEIPDVLLIAGATRFTFVYHLPSEASYAIPVASIQWQVLCRTRTPLDVGADAHERAATGHSCFQ